MTIMDSEEVPPLGIVAILGEYKIPVLLGSMSILTILLSLILLVKSTQTTEPIRFSSQEATGSALGVGVLTVDVEGAVVSPGVYTLPAGSRIEDAIVAAGGETGDIDVAQFAKTINRAMKLVDGSKVYIPSFLSSSVRSTVGNLVSVNTGSESELDGLPGVGPVTAQKIIDNRPYQTLDDLVTKKAIGPSLYEKIQAQLSL